MGPHHEYRPLLRQPFANKKEQREKTIRVSIGDLLGIEYVVCFKSNLDHPPGLDLSSRFASTVHGSV